MKKHRSSLKHAQIQLKYHHFKENESILRVLLDKPPDIETPIVWGQFSFGCIINSTYSGGLPKLKSLDLGACTVPWDTNQDLELK